MANYEEFGPLVRRVHAVDDSKSQRHTAKGERKHVDQ